MKKIIIKQATSDNDFVGMKVKQDEVIITFPIGYNIEEIEIESTDSRLKDYYNDISNLLNCLSYKYDNYYDEGYNKFNFSSAIYIIEYYLKYGLYKKNNNEINLNTKGKIDWKKTINNIEPIYYNGSIIYTDLYSINNNKIEDIITIIQKYCLKISIKIIGWLYKIDDINLEETQLSIEEMLYYLNKELYSVNDDNRKSIIKEMINFINGVDTTDLIASNEVIIGRNYFDKVWEGLLKKQLYELYDEFECLPNTYYITKNNKRIENSSLYPDIIINTNNTIIIFDAKYYKINNLPESSDICKQLFYAQYIRHKKRNYKIINVFLLPNNLKNNYEYYGYALSNHSNEEEKIYTYYLDTKSVLNNNQTVYDLVNMLLEIKE